MRSGLYMAVAMAAAILVGSCGGPAPEKKAPPPPAAVEPTWRYNVAKDEMTGESTEFACAEAEKPVVAEPPHDTATPSLCVYRRKGEVSGVILLMHGSGQIDCRECEVRTKIDNEPPETMAADAIDDDRSSLAFTFPTWMAGKIFLAERLAIEPPLYGAADPVVWFKVDHGPWKDETKKPAPKTDGEKPKG